MVLGCTAVFSQNNVLNKGKSAANVQLDAQYYIPDSSIGPKIWKTK